MLSSSAGNIFLWSWCCIILHTFWRSACMPTCKLQPLSSWSLQGTDNLYAYSSGQEHINNDHFVTHLPQMTLLRVWWAINASQDVFDSYAYVAVGVTSVWHCHTGVDLDIYSDLFQDPFSVLSLDICIFLLKPIVCFSPNPVTLYVICVWRFTTYFVYVCISVAPCV